MNTRGLTELIVLNLALEKGVISDALFAALVMMALVTTFMAGPLLQAARPEERATARRSRRSSRTAREQSSAEFPALPVPERSILVAPQTDGALPQLLALAEPLARSEPPRELILARLVRPPRGASARGGLQTENRLLQRGDRRGRRSRGSGWWTRASPRGRSRSASADPGADLVRLAESEEVDLLLWTAAGRCSASGVPRGDVGTVLREAPCDVAVLVAREGSAVAPGPERPVLVPFGGAEHDWAALELGAWIASATGAPLKLLGAAGQSEDERDASARCSATPRLLVQQYAGIPAEPIVAEPRPRGHPRGRRGRRACS